jgi:uncharacterized membrane protein YoaK (UPF0700 family)
VSDSHAVLFGFFDLVYQRDSATRPHNPNRVSRHGSKPDPATLGAVQPVSDDFLLTMAQVSATLIGLFLVGVFFFVDGPLSGRSSTSAISRQYLRSGTRITLIVFAIPLGVSLALVALDIVWARALFAALSAVLIAANVDSIRRVRGERSMILLANEAVATGLTLLLVILPWAMGGLRPTREDLTWAILLAFVAGLLSVSTTVMSTFDTPSSTATTDVDEAAAADQRRRPPPLRSRRRHRAARVVRHESD